jgi:hypothetical protein
MFSNGNDPKTSIASPIRILFIAFAAVISFLQGLDSSIAGRNLPRIPADCGELICQSNENQPGQIYIIALVHRDALTVLNGNNSSRVQAEIYRIGDWLIHQQGVELLLPEGFFVDKSAKVETKKINAGSLKTKCTGIPDMKEIEGRLADNSTYVNAEMLLNKNHRLKLRQVEDENLYFAARESLLKFVKTDNEDLCQYLTEKAQLDYLQERRTAAMVQRIPRIVNEEFQQGNIRTKKAIFTIGTSHIHNIIESLSKGRIDVYSPLLASGKGEDYSAELNLRKENFGVSIIIPRTVADDQKMLELNGLDKIVAQFRTRSSVVRSETFRPIPERTPAQKH